MNQKRISILFGILVMFFALPSFSQEEYSPEENEDYYSDITPKHSFSGTIGLPISTSNKPYARFLDGMIDVSAYYQYSLKNNLNFGAGMNYSMFNVDKNRLSQQILGRQNNLGAFARFGYEKYHSMRFATDLALQVGYVHSTFDTDSNKTVFGENYQMGSLWIQPSISFLLTVSEFAAFKFYASYNTYFNPFELKYIGSTNNEGYKPKDFEGNIGFMSFGFGYTYYFKQY